MGPSVVPEIAEHEEYIDCVRDILCRPIFQSTDQYVQYGATTCKTHCMQVLYLGHKLCRQPGGNWRSATRAGLLHDLFLCDWRTHVKGTGQYLHGFTHLEAVLANADRYFRLTGEERMTILKYMWPLTLVPPISRVGYTVTCVDKYCSIVETTARFKHWIRMCLFAQPARWQSYVFLKPSRSPFERGKNNPITNVWTQMLDNQLLMSVVTGWVTTQFLKTLIDFALNKNFSTERLVRSGGMPSSHFATVCGLITAALPKYGVGFFEFIVSLTFSMIIMYDATGVKREIGKQAELLNLILSENPLKLSAEVLQEKLKEYAGHTPLQILAGAILGIGLVPALNSCY